jgi:type II secretory pathway component PulM
MNELWNRLISTWDTLSPRERILASIAGGSLLFGLLFFGAVRPLIAAVADDGEVARAEQQVAVMKRLRTQYEEVHSRLSSVEQRIASSPSGGSLRTLLDSLARNAEVSVESMEEREAADSETYQERRVDVTLRRVTVEQAVSYLHSIESNERLLSIKSLRIKNRPDKSNLLDVTFSVSSFTPL